MAERTFLRRYKTNETSPEVLEAMLVQRHALADDLVKRVRESALTGNKHFVLIVGPRGIGKTHLVALVVNRILDRPEHADVRERLRIAWLDENQTSTSLATLLNRVYTALVNEYPTEFTTDIRQTAGGQSPKEAAQVLAKHLLEELGDRTCLIVAENFDEIFQHMGNKGQQELRSFLQQHPRFAVLATSQQLFDGVSLRTSPFFGMFQVEHLQTLSLDDSVALFRRIAEHHHDTELLQFLGTRPGRDRVKALQFLAGGMPRLHVMLAEFMTKQTLDELVSLFEKLRDDLSNYYLERMRWLSPQQREIVQWLCQREAATPVKELAAALFMQPQDASSQLMRLRDLGYVESTASGKESLYDLSEPLMRMSLNEDKRQSPDAPIPIIVEFLRIFFSRKELEDLNQTTTLPRAKGTLAAALQLPRPEPILPQKSRTDRVQKKKAADRHFERGCDFFDNGEFRAALAEFDATLQRSPDDAIVLFNRGVTYSELGESQKSIADYTRIIDELPDAPTKQRAHALHNRGVTYWQLGKSKTAIADYTRVIDELLDAPAEVIAKSLVNRGGIYGQLGESQKAIADFTRVIDELPDVPTKQKARALFDRGVTYSVLGERRKAISDYTRVIDELPDTSAELKAKTLVNRGLDYGELSETPKAIADFTRVIDGLPDAPTELKAKALVHRGGTYGERLKAIADYCHVIDELPNVPTELKVDALLSRGGIYLHLGDIQKAVSDYTSVIDQFPDASTEWKAHALNNRGCVYWSLGETEKAILDVEHAIAIQPDYVFPRLNRVEFCLRSGLWNEGWTALRDTLARFPPTIAEEAGDVPEIMRIILQCSLAANVWRERVRTLVEIYVDTAVEAFLGEGMVQSLSRVPTDKLSETALDEWRQVWLDVVCEVEENSGKKLVAMRIPLRLFDVGMRYLATHNHRVLFDLPLEQRRLLKELLNITDESPAKPKKKKTPRRK